jgi:hypothetical protein
MKRVIIFLILIANFNTYAQQEQTTATEKWTFPIKTKFTVKVIPTSTGDFKYSVIKVEPYTKIVDASNSAKVFKKKGEKETIEFCFCLEIPWDRDPKKDDPYMMLLMNNRSKYSFKFKTEIQTEKDGVFKKISNIGTHAGSTTSDRWAKETYQIRISEFELKK